MGRDENFKRAIRSGGIPDLSKMKTELPDPRQWPSTVHEIKLRGCHHKYEPLMMPEPNGTLTMKMWSIVLVDPLDRTVYHYGLAVEDLEVEITKLQALVELRDHPPTIEQVTGETQGNSGGTVTEVIFGGDTPSKEEPSDDAAE